MEVLGKRHDDMAEGKNDDPFRLMGEETSNFVSLEFDFDTIGLDDVVFLETVLLVGRPQLNDVSRSTKSLITRNCLCISTPITNSESASLHSDFCRDLDGDGDRLFQRLIALNNECF